MSDPTWAVLDDGWVAAQGANEYDAIFRCIDERNATLAVKILNLKEARCIGLDVRVADLEAALEAAEGENERYLQERHEWQRLVSDALGVTTQELHGGGATVYASLDKCVERIGELLAERDAGWVAAYRRGRDDERNGRYDAAALAAPVEPQGPTSEERVAAPWWPVSPEMCGQCGWGEFRETHSETHDADLEEGSALVEFTCQGCGYIVTKFGHMPEGATSE